MKSQRVEKLKAMLEEIKHHIDEQAAKKLELEKYHRILMRLSSFAPECAQCHQYLNEMENHVIQLKEKLGLAQLAEADAINHKQKINTISTHLMKQHKLVTSGLYLSIYMSIGTSLGVVFGLLIFDNIGLGLPLGIGIGVAIGAFLDTDAKKKGMIL